MLNSLFHNSFSLLIGFVILFDQITKYLVKKFIPYYDSISIVGDYIRFTFIENSGIAFGIDTSDFHIYITILTVFAIIILFFYYFDIKSKEPLLIFPLSLIIGGAIGNAIDRILVLVPNSGYNGVVDFIDLGINDFRWYVFNIADTSITIGAILYILAQYSYNKKDNATSRNI